MQNKHILPKHRKRNVYVFNLPHKHAANFNFRISTPLTTRWPGFLLWVCAHSFSPVQSPRLSKTNLPLSGRGSTTGNREGKSELRPIAPAETEELNRHGEPVPQLQTRVRTALCRLQSPADANTIRPISHGEGSALTEDANATETGGRMDRAMHHSLGRAAGPGKDVADYMLACRRPSSPDASQTWIARESAFTAKPRFPAPQD